MPLPRAIRYRLHRFKRLQGSIHSLSLGAAIGAAIGITPTIPLHSVLILAATLACRSNPIAGILAATVVSNPLTLVPQYWLAWRIGDWFLAETLDLIHIKGIRDSLQVLGDLSTDALLVMLAGGVVLALPTGLCAYLLVHRFFTRLRNRRRRAHLLNDRRP